MFLGYEVLEILTALSQEEIDELSTSLKMKPGHKKMFSLAIQKAEREKEEHEQKRNKEKAKRDREEEEQEEKWKLANELSKIERKQILAKARSTRDAENPEHIDTKPKAPESAKPAAQKNTATSEQVHLPAWKDFAAFISHKKMHTEFGDSSETLSIRLKVRLFACTPVVTSFYFDRTC